LKHLRQVVWHILPTLVVFLALVGVQFFGSAVIAFVFIIDDAYEAISTWEFVTLIALVLLRALAVCIVLLPAGLILDKLTRSRPVWLRLLLPIPFIVASGFLIYGYWHIPEETYVKWFSSVYHVVIFLIALIAVFAPYWYILQALRFFVWLVKKIRVVIARAVSPSRACT
jgi:hypothetical protein